MVIIVKEIMIFYLCKGKKEKIDINLCAYYIIVWFVQC